MPRVFLLSPANLRGSRTAMLLEPRRRFALADDLHSETGAPIGDVFAFVSGLYFRGKLTYARRFASPPEAAHPVVRSGVHIITPATGLQTPERAVKPAELVAFSSVDIAVDNARFTEPLAATAADLARAIGPVCQVVLLGSIASPKYVDVLLDVFGDRLHFPLDFVGRGDMSRGGLLLRQATAGVELEYGPVRGAVRRGTRPPKLPPLARRAVAGSPRGRR
jgi:hypothetical protein